MDSSPSITRRRRRVIAWSVVAGLLAVVLGAGVWVATRALVVQNDLAAVAALQPEARSALSAGDVDALGDIAAELDAHTASAAAAAADPLWRAAEVVPFVGTNLSAVRTVSEQLARVSEHAVTPAVEVGELLAHGGLINDGAFNVELISRAHGPLRGAAETLGDAETVIAAIPRDGLIDPIAAGVSELQGMFELLSSSLSEAAEMTGVLPVMLGSEQPRSILVMVQNNAELRSGGGITGSFAEIVATNGALEIVRQADSSEFTRTTQEIVPVPASTTALYGDIVGRYVQNASTTPDFELTAELTSAWWTTLTGQQPDIVLSIDPLVLRALLEVTGPIVLDDGEQLTRDEFVRQVMITPYLRLSPKEQTAFFQDLTERFFSHLTTSTAPPTAWITALQSPISQGRISVWSSVSDEADVLRDSPLAGPLARHLAAGESAFSVYFNDVTGAKMDSSLNIAMATATGSCRADQRPEVSVRVRLENEAPKDAGTAWPYSMTGSGRWGTEAGHIATAVAVAAPPGWFFAGSTVDGDAKPSVDVEDGGFPTSAVEVDLAPGEAADIEIRFVAPSDDAVTPHLLHTPLIRAAAELETAPLSCG